MLKLYGKCGNLLHVINKHRFKRVHPKYPKCQHKTYTKRESLKKKWFVKDSVAYDALERVIMDKKTLKDMGQLVNPLHTGSLEVFHSLINSYASKRNHFELNVMDARIKLAILDHNCNISRKQATVQRPRVGSGKKGEKQWKYISSKLSKEWVAKEKKEKNRVLLSQSCW